RGVHREDAVPAGRGDREAGPCPDLDLRGRRPRRHRDPRERVTDDSAARNPRSTVTDTYLRLVNSGVTKKLAKQLGLPRPAVLRRYEPGQPLVTGPVLVLGRGDSLPPAPDAAPTSPDADVVARVLA